MSRKLSLLVLSACAIVFAAGLAQLFKLRFERGDIYPEYSTLRLDPLGTSAFYESLGRLPGISVSRDFSLTDRLPDGNGTAYLHLAGRSRDWKRVPEETFKEMESFLTLGGRLVVAFLPETRKPFELPSERERKRQQETEARGLKEKEAGKSRPGKTAKKPTKFPPGDDQLSHWVSLKDRWGVEFEFRGIEQKSGVAYEPMEVENAAEPSLSGSISWHSGLVFTNLDKAWRVIYARDAGPVLIERKFRSGSIVFSTDSYFLSNEAMRKERHADLLAWLAGACRQIVFDEAHLGITENAGVAMLVRKYRLHGLVAGLLLLAGLFIWKNSASFAPAYPDEEVEAYSVGQDSAAGFVKLLRRHIAARDLLNLCLAEWKTSFGHGQISAVKVERVQAVIDAEKALRPKQRDSIRTYQAVCRVLKESPGFREPGVVSRTKLHHEAGQEPISPASPAVLSNGEGEASRN